MRWRAALLVLVSTACKQPAATKAAAPGPVKPLSRQEALSLAMPDDTIGKESLEEYIKEGGFAAFDVDKTKAREPPGECDPTGGAPIELKDSTVTISTWNPVPCMDIKDKEASSTASAVLVDFERACEGWDVRSMAGKSLRDVMTEKPCERSTRQRLSLVLTARMTSTGTDGTITGVMESHHDIAAADGTACRSTVKGNLTTYSDCVVSTLTFMRDTHATAGVQDEVAYASRRFGGSKGVQRHTGARFPFAGRVDVYFEGWEGSVTFTGDNDKPTWTLRKKGQASLSGVYPDGIVAAQPATTLPPPDAPPDTNFPGDAAAAGSAGGDMGTSGPTGLRLADPAVPRPQLPRVALPRF